MSSDSSQKWQKFQKLRPNGKKVARHIRRVEKATVRHAHKFLLRRWTNAKEVRRIIATWLFVVGCLIAAAVYQFGIDQQSFQTQTQATAGTYAEAVQGPIETLNPLFAVSPAEKSVSQLLFSRIMTYDTSGEINYDLAKSVTRSKDGLIYKVVLRDNVWWHDGVKLTARDVVYTAGLLANDETRAQIKGWESIKVEQLDDKTITFTLPAPYAAFEHALVFPIVPEHILGDVEPGALREHSFSRAPVGSGPFAINFLQDVNVTAQQNIVHMKANPAYYGGAPKLARFQIHTYATSQEITRALGTNEVNAAVGLSTADANTVDMNRYTVSSSPTQSGVYAFLNNESGILSDVKVRRALQYGTDTAAIRSNIATNNQPLTSPFTDSQVNGVPSTPAYNIDQAKKLLYDAGWKLQNGVRKKGNKELRLSVVTTQDGQFERALETLIGQWRQLGVAVDERVIDAADPAQGFAQSVLQARNYDVLIYQLAIGRDPDVYAYWHSSQATARGLNLSNYSSETSDDILSTARTTLDASLRNAKYVAFAKQWRADVPAIGLYQSNVLYVENKTAYTGIQTLTLNTPEDRFSNVLYWSSGQSSVYKTP